MKKITALWPRIADWMFWSKASANKPADSQLRNIPVTGVSDHVKKKTRKKKSARMLRDLAVVFIIFSVAFILTFVLDLHASFEAASLQLKNSPFQYDELIVALAILAAALSAFAVRRWRELEVEMDERIDAEIALKASEERYRTLAEAAQDFIFIVDREGRIKYVNSFAAEQLGSTPQEIIGRPRGEVFPHGMADEQVRELEQVFQEGYPLNVENRATFRGRESWQSTALVPIREKDGALHEVLGISRDITLRKRAEESLRQTKDNLEQLVSERTSELKEVNERLHRELDVRKRAEEKLQAVNRALRTATASNHALVGALDEKQLLEDICGAVVDVGGYRFAWVGFAEHDNDRTVSPAAAGGQGSSYLENARISWNADSRHGQGPTGKTIRTGRPSVVRDIMTDPVFDPWREEASRSGFASAVALPLAGDGKPFGALTIYASEADAFGKEEVDLLLELASDLAYGISAIRTRSERDQQAVALRRTGEQLSLLVESLPIILYTSNAGGDFGVTYVSPNIKIISGYQPEDLTSDSTFWSEHIHPEDAPRIFDQLPRIFDQGYHEYEYRWRTADGSYRWFLDILRLVRSPDDENAYIVGMWLDITTRKQSEDSLRRMKDELEAKVNERSSLLDETNRELEARSQELKQREHETALLEYMDEMLESCLSADEAYGVFTQAATDLFPGHSGCLYIFNPRSKKYEAASRWGDENSWVPEFSRDECWSLRQGQLHSAAAGHKGTRCRHVVEDYAYLCVPLRAASLTLGVLHLRLPGSGEPEKPGQAVMHLAHSMAEHIGLALYNLKLREVLDRMSIEDPFTAAKSN